MPRIVTLQFITAGKLYDFDALDQDLAAGDKVIVETERGLGIATVIKPPVERIDNEGTSPAAPIRRKANAEDLLTLEKNNRKEQEAYDFCMKRIIERGMQMKLVRVEYLFDGSKAVFFFTADGRVDFRDLVKDLAHSFHTRIEMRQIGVRDESKMVGGIGICGRELCCCSWLRDFQPVSVKMAKEQNLALNPNKISGQCGRLLCCLDYEYETYCCLRKNFPKCGKKMQTEHACGVVDKINILTGDVTLKQDDGKLIVVKQSDAIAEGTISETQSKPTAPTAASPSARPQHKGRDKRHESRKSSEAQAQPNEKVIAVTSDEDGKSVEKAQETQPRPAKKKNRFRKHGHRKNPDGNSGGNTPPSGAQ